MADPILHRGILDSISRVDTRMRDQQQVSSSITSLSGDRNEGNGPPIISAPNDRNSQCKRSLSLESEYSEVVNWLVNDLEDFARSIEPIPVVPSEFFQYPIVFKLPDQPIGGAVFDI